MTDGLHSPPPAGPVLITGGAGFIGSSLADRLAAEGHTVRILDALARPGVDANLDWLRARHGDRIVPIRARVEDPDVVQRAVEGASAVLHLAAQVAVTSSLVDPRADFATNLAGTLELLEAVRRLGRPVPFLLASTNKVYGDLARPTLTLDGGRWMPACEHLRRGVDESMPLAFHTPYGCSKGAADQYVLDYARCFGLPAVVLRMSCIYGERQLGTEDQGWVAHFAHRVLAGGAITIYGDGRQVRDLLDVRACVDAWLAAWRRADRLAGSAYNLGGGPANAVSLREVLDALVSLTGRRADLAYADWRPGDQRWYVSDIRRARAGLGLAEPRPWRQGLADLVAGLTRTDGLRPLAPQLPATIAEARVP